jgi:hypothetical protein
MKIVVALSLLLVALIIYGVNESMPKKKVYACAEVTKEDPEDVQKICNKRWRRNENHAKDN